MLEIVPFLQSTKECSKVEIVLVLVPALSYQAYQSVDRQREYTTKRNETMAIFRGGEEGIGWLIVKVLRVALWEGENREKCFKSRFVMVENKKWAKGLGDNTEHNETGWMT